MIAQRLMAKMNRDFEVADRVQTELAEEGIFVNDRTKEWRADGVRFIDPSEGRRKPSDRNRPYVKSHYSQSLPDGAKFSLERINDLVAERTECKVTKNFNKADSIRDELEQSCNVIIDDVSRVLPFFFYHDVQELTLIAPIIEDPRVVNRRIIWERC